MTNLATTYKATQSVGDDDKKETLHGKPYELAVASLAFVIGNEYGGSEAEGNRSCLAISWLL